MIKKPGLDITAYEFVTTFLNLVYKFGKWFFFLSRASVILSICYSKINSDHHFL